jgi:hypothetical protein
MIRVLSKYVQEKYISDGQKDYGQMDSTCCHRGAAHRFYHPGICGGRKRERSGPAVRGFRKLARQRRERRTSNPPVQRAAATQIRSPGTDLPRLGEEDHVPSSPPPETIAREEEARYVARLPQIWTGENEGKLAGEIR